MPLNVGELFASLSFKTDRSGAQQFSQDYDAAAHKAREKIEAQLGAKVDPTAFAAYHKALDQAERRAKEKDAFKAQLGGDFDSRAFNAYQRELRKVEARAAKAIEQEVKVDYDARGAKQAEASLEQLGGSFRKLFEQSAKITAAGLGAQAMSAAGGAAVALTSALAPLSGALAAYPALGSAAGQGLGVLKLATAGLGDGMQAAAEGGKAWEDALKKLTPQQAEFIRSIKPVIDHVKGLQATAREGFLPGAQRGILDANRNFGVLRDGVGRTSKVLGGLAEQAGKLLGSKGFGRDMDTQMRRNDTTIRRLGDAGLHLFDALRHVTIAAGPLVDWMTKSIDHGAKLVDVWAKQGRESGKLTHFFNETRTAISRVARIGGDLATAFFNIGKAGKPLGDHILVNLVKAAEAFKDWTASARGQNAIKKWFDDAKPAIDELGSLVVDAAKAFGRLGSGKQVAPLLRTIRTDLLPVVERIVDGTTKAFGPPFLRLVTEAIKAFEPLVGTTGPLTLAATLLGDIFEAINKVTHRFPAIGSAVAALATVASLYSALRITATLTGITRIISLLRGVRTAAATTGAVSVVAGGAGGAAGGAAAARSGVAGLIAGFVTKFPAATIGAAIAVAFAAALPKLHRGKGLGGSVFDFEGDKIGPAATAIQRFNAQLERLDSIGDKKGADKLARQFDKLVDASGKFRGSARDVDRLTGAAKDLADEGGTMQRSLNRTLDRSAAHFRDFRRTGSNNMEGIRKATSDNMHFIRRTLGEDSAEGKEALARNFRLARSAIRQAMRDGRVSVKEGLAEIQRLMRAELKQYGITGGVASSIIKHGNIKGSDAPAAGHARGGFVQRVKRAVGGWIGARGLVSDDVVPIAPGALAAFGEYLAVGSDGRKAVLNRHQAPVADLMLASGGYPTLDQGADLSAIEKALAPLGGLDRLFATITRPHMFQGGGIVPVPGFPGERAASSVIPKIQQIARTFGLTLTDAYGQGHKSPGHTIYGTAADFAGPDANMDRAVRALVGQGYVVGYDGRYGSADWPGHGPAAGQGGANAHLHVELGGKGGAITGAVAAAVRKITAPQTGARGALGAIVQGALNAATRGANARLEKAAASSLTVPVGGGGGLAGGSARANRAIGQRMAAAVGWTGAQWSALDRLWTGESGWNERIPNQQGSGAYGIPQALPASKMASAGSDWQTNPATQIRWGLDYIKQRYGTPAAAYRFWLSQSPHWYGLGGMVRRFAGGGRAGTAKERAWLNRSWAQVAPLFGLPADSNFGSLFKHIRLSQENMFVGVSSDPGAKGHGTDDLLWPRWLWQSSGKQRALDNRSKLQLFIHEMAHRFQSARATPSTWEGEGGAEAFARLAMDRQFGGRRSNKGDPYNAYVTRVVKQRGMDWIARTQFGKAMGGYVQHFAGGGKVKTDKLAKTVGKATAGLIRKVRPMQTDRSERFDTLMGHVEAWDQDYSRWERRFNVTDEELVDADTGAVNVKAVRDKAHELAQLIAIRRRIEDDLEKAQVVVKRIIASYKHIIRNLRNSLKHAKRKERGGIKTYIGTYEGRVGEWEGKLGEVGDTLFDTRTDLQELRAERKEVLGTKATPQTVDTDDIGGGADLGGGGDLGGDVGGGDAGGGADAGEAPAERPLLTGIQEAAAAGLERDAALAALTPDTADDERARSALRNFWTDVLAYLQATGGSDQLITQAAQTLKGFIPDVAATAAVDLNADLTAFRAGQADLLRSFAGNALTPGQAFGGGGPFSGVPSLGAAMAGVRGFGGSGDLAGTLGAGAGGPVVQHLNVTFASAPESGATLVQQLRNVVENGSG